MKMKINKQSIYFMIVVLLFIYPDGIEYINGLDALFSVFALGRYLVSFYYIYKTLSTKNVRRYVWEKTTYTVLLFVLFMIISAILNGTAKPTLLMSYVTLLGFWCFNAYYISKKCYYDKIVSTYKSYMIFALGVQLGTFLIFPNGIIQGRIGTVHFLGGKNGVSLYAILFILILCLQKEKLKKILITCIILTLVMALFNTFSGMGALLLITLFVGISLFKDKELLGMIKKSGLKIILFGLILFFILVVLLGENSGLIVSITNMLGKDFTFSGRRAIWDEAQNYIMDNPWFGVGQGALYDVWNNGKYVYSAHNSFLDTAVAFGIPAQLFFIAILCSVVYKLIKSNKSYRNYILINIIALLIVMMFEAIETDYMVWAILVFAYYERPIDGDLGRENRNENRHSNYMV